VSWLSAPCHVQNDGKCNINSLRGKAHRSNGGLFLHSKLWFQRDRSNTSIQSGRQTEARRLNTSVEIELLQPWISTSRTLRGRDDKDNATTISLYTSRPLPLPLPLAASACTLGPAAGVSMRVWTVTRRPMRATRRGGSTRLRLEGPAMHMDVGEESDDDDDRDEDSSTDEECREVESDATVAVA